MGPCIFCRKSDGGWTSRAHIVPEDLGNAGLREGEALLLLPPGIECDRCNNSFSNVESHLYQQGLGRVAALLNWRMRPNWSIPADASHLPSELSNVESIKIEPYRSDEERESVVSEFINLPAEQKELFSRTLQSGVTVKDETQPRMLSAYLSKILIECVAHILGRDAALNPVLDHHRNNARRLVRKTEWLPFYRSSAQQPLQGWKIEVIFADNPPPSQSPHGVLWFGLHGTCLCMPIEARSMGAWPHIAGWELVRP